MNLKSIIDSLPSSWYEVSLKQFQTLVTSEITETDDLFNGVTNTLEMVSKLTGIESKELENLLMRDITEIANKLSFTNEEPKPKKESIIVWKKVDEITFNDFITFTQIDETKRLENIHVFIKNFSTSKLSDEEILNLPITEVITGFFLLRKQLNKYLRSSIRSTTYRVVKLLIVQKLQQFNRKTKQLGNRFLKLLAGIF